MHKLFKSFRHAFSGIAYALREERSFFLEFCIAVVVIFLAWYFPLSGLERMLLILVTVFVLSLELVNTSFERMLDLLKPQVHPYVKVIKDLVAGSVLIAAMGAAFIGGCIFLPYLF